MSIQMVGMSPLQHMLLKLSEEADEVGQRAAKMMQYGGEEVQPTFQHTNAERLRHEINDLMAVVVILEGMGAIPTISDADFAAWVVAKRAKIDKYLILSRSLGMVAPPNFAPGPLPSGQWKPIATAPDNVRVLVRGPSGYLPPNDVHIETAHTDTEYRPPLRDGRRRWLTDGGDAITDSWPQPEEWMELV